MATKTIPATGVYRNQAGHSVFLRKGEQASEALLADYKLDESASKEYAQEPERSYFSSVVDAPQDQGKAVKASAEERAEPPVENRMDPPVENRSDADLAASAAKGSKK